MPDVSPEQVVEAIAEVRDPEVEASEYSFLSQDDKIHPAPPKKGNSGLANWIANLAIFQVEDHLVIDEGLIEEADRILTEQHDTGYDRSRIEGIVKDTGIRPGKKKSMLGNHFDEGDDVDGHERLLEMVEEFYAETGQEEDLENVYKDKGLLLECDNMAGGNVFGLDPATGIKVAVDAIDRYTSDEASDYTVIPVHEEDNSSFSSKPENNQHNKGGDNDMTRSHDDPDDLGRQATDARLSQQEMYDNLGDLETAVLDTLVGEYEMALDDAYDAVRTAEHKVGDAVDNAESDYDTVAEFATGLTEEVLEEADLDLSEFTDRAYDRFDTEMGTMQRNRERFRDDNSDLL